MNANLVSNRKRAHFNAYKALFHEGVQIHEDFVRLEQVLKKGVNSYTFNTDVSAISRMLEKGVAKTNNFRALAMGIFIDQRIVGMDGHAVLRSCPDSEYFQQNNVKDLMAVFNGKHTISVGTTKYVDGEHNLKFYKETSAGGSQMLQAIKFDSSDFAGVFVELEPTIDFGSSESNKIVVELTDLNNMDITPKQPTFLPDEKPYTLENVLTVYFVGFSAVNGSFILDKK